MSTMMHYNTGDTDVYYLYGGDVEFDTARIMNTYADGSMSVAKLEFPAEVHEVTYGDPDSLSTYLEMRGYSRFEM